MILFTIDTNITHVETLNKITNLAHKNTCDYISCDFPIGSILLLRTEMSSAPIINKCCMPFLGHLVNSTVILEWNILLFTSICCYMLQVFYYIYIYAGSNRFSVCKIHKQFSICLFSYVIVSTLMVNPFTFLRWQAPIVLDNLETKKIILVHGEGFGAWCWYKIIPLLEEAGLNPVALDLTGSGIDHTDVSNIMTMADYTKPLLDYLRNLHEDEKVKLFCRIFIL